MARRILEVGVGGNRRYGLRVRASWSPTDELYMCDIEPNLDLGIIYCNAEDYLPYPNNFFDEVVMSHLLEHLNNPMKALKEAYRVLKPGGLLHVYVPNFVSPNAKKDPDHKHIFTLFSLKRMLLRAGFKIRSIHGIGCARESLKPLYMLLALIYSLVSNEIYIVAYKPST